MTRWNRDTKALWLFALASLKDPWKACTETALDGKFNLRNMISYDWLFTFSSFFFPRLTCGFEQRVARMSLTLWNIRHHIISGLLTQHCNDVLQEMKSCFSPRPWMHGICRLQSTIWDLSLTYNALPSSHLLIIALRCRATWNPSISSRIVIS